MQKLINKATNFSKDRLSNDDIQKLIIKLSRYKRNDYIYKSAFIRAGFNKRFINQLFEYLYENDLLNKKYRIIDPFSQEFTNDLFDSLDDIPDELFSDFADDDFKTKEQIRELYQIKGE